MKRTGNIYIKIYDVDNIKEAIMKASLGKRDRNYVKKILNDVDYYANEISELLKNNQYVASLYVIKKIIDGASGKERIIYKPNFYPDQIIHWALMLQLQPIFMKGMYHYNCGSIPARGTDLGQKTIRKWLDNDRKHTKYCLKIDVKKFYPSINNEILKAMFRTKIKDYECLNLIDTIVDSNQGLPIGNYTSQWFANFFLQGLDHHIKETLKVKHYVRYVDDMVMFGGNKKVMHKIKIAIDEYLLTIGLKLKENWQVFRTSSRPIDFLGFKFYYGKTTLRKRTALRMRRRIQKIAKKPRLNHYDASAVISYWGWIKRSNSYYFYHKYIKPFVSIKKARKVVSCYGKREALRRSSVIQSRNTVCY